MAKVDFNNMQDDSAYSSTSNAGNDVGFFTLRNDNDEAIVRFMCDSTDDFEILTVHDIKIGDKYRKLNCIRDFRDPVESCPMCASGSKISQRFFIKMLQYDKVQDPATGLIRVVAKPMMWERSTQYAKTLKSYLDNYGPLSDVICKVIRHGKAGDMQTTYEIVPNLSKTVYSDDIYVKDASLFGDFTAFGTIVMDKTYEEIAQFQMTGQFPQRATKENAELTPRTNETVAPVVPNVPVQQTAPVVNPNEYAPANFMNTAPVTGAPAFGGTSAAPRQTMPWDNAQSVTAAGGFDRPRRY